MRVTKYECTIGLLLLVFTGCASGSKDDEMLGSGGAPAANFGNSAQPDQAHPSAGAPAPAAGSGGATGKPADPVKGNGGSGGQAQAGKGGTGGGGAGMGAAGMSTAGMGAAGMDSAGTGGADEEDPFAGLLPDDPADPADPSTTPPAAGMCADAVCFDVFDCYLWHADIVDCGFTDCVDFVCK